MNSPNWDGSKFENYEPILNIVKHSEDDEEDKGFIRTMMDLVLPEKGKGIPAHAVPAVKTDFKNLPSEGVHVVWFGHSSKFHLCQINGIDIR